MLNFKVQHIIITAGLLAFTCSTTLFTGCIETKYKLNINNELSDKQAAGFFGRLPGISGTVYNKTPVTGRAKKIEVYKASFGEASIERDNLIEFTELNSRSEQPTVAYHDVDGFKQELYLLKYNFTSGEGDEKFENTAVVFLSLHYRPLATEPFMCTGPGPAYWGLLFEDNRGSSRYISFDSVLTIKNVNSNPYLQASRPKKKNNFNLLFMPVDFPASPVPLKTSIDIKKIVRMDPNRIGGTKPLVFDIPAIFHDSRAMHFTYIKTITLNP